MVLDVSPVEGWVIIEDTKYAIGDGET